MRCGEAVRFPPLNPMSVPRRSNASGTRRASIAKISHNEQSGEPDCIFPRHLNREKDQHHD
jgi:hypothetical protein